MIYILIGPTCLHWASLRVYRKYTLGIHSGRAFITKRYSSLPIRRQWYPAADWEDDHGPGEV